MQIFITLFNIKPFFHFFKLFFAKTFFKSDFIHFGIVYVFFYKFRIFINFQIQRATIGRRCYIIASTYKHQSQERNRNHRFSFLHSKPFLSFPLPRFCILSCFLRLPFEHTQPFQQPSLLLPFFRLYNRQYK